MSDTADVITILTDHVLSGNEEEATHVLELGVVSDKDVERLTENGITPKAVLEKKMFGIVYPVIHLFHRIGLCDVETLNSIIASDYPDKMSLFAIWGIQKRLLQTTKVLDTLPEEQFQQLILQYTDIEHLLELSDIPRVKILKLCLERGILGEVISLALDVLMEKVLLWRKTFLTLCGIDNITEEQKVYLLEIVGLMMTHPDADTILEKLFEEMALYSKHRVSPVYIHLIQTVPPKTRQHILKTLTIREVVSCHEIISMEEAVSEVIRRLKLLINIIHTTSLSSHQLDPYIKMFKEFPDTLTDEMLNLLNLGLFTSIGNERSAIKTLRESFPDRLSTTRLKRLHCLFLLLPSERTPKVIRRSLQPIVNQICSHNFRIILRLMSCLTDHRGAVLDCTVPDTGVTVREECLKTIDGTFLEKYIDFIPPEVCSWRDEQGDHYLKKWLNPRRIRAGNELTTKLLSLDWTKEQMCPEGGDNHLIAALILTIENMGFATQLIYKLFLKHSCRLRLVDFALMPDGRQKLADWVCETGLLDRDLTDDMCREVIKTTIEESKQNYSAAGKYPTWFVDECCDRILAEGEMCHVCCHFPMSISINPCGHRICVPCYRRIVQCHICRGKIEGAKVNTVESKSVEAHDEPKRSLTDGSSHPTPASPEEVEKKAEEEVEPGRS